MAKVTTKDLAELLDQLRSQMSQLSERLARVEAALPPSSPAVAAPAPPPAPAAQAAAPAPGAKVPEDILLVISAAVAAFLGVRAQVRQVRLLRTPAWAQQGRVSIQASHSLQ